MTEKEGWPMSHAYTFIVQTYGVKKCLEELEEVYQKIIKIHKDPDFTNDKSTLYIDQLEKFMEKSLDIFKFKDAIGRISKVVEDPDIKENK